MQLASIKSNKDRTSRLRFRLGVFLYQKTGILTSFVRDVEDDYVEDNLNTFYKKYSRSKKLKKDFSFSAFVGLQKGVWQCNYGLYRSISYPKSKLGRFLFNKYQLFCWRLRVILKNRNI